MKALSLTQPYATLVAIGAKQIETRSWSTSYRGPLAIHAAKGFPKWARDLCFEEPFREELRGAGIRRIADLPLGAVVGIVRLTSISTTDYLMDVSQHPGASAGTSRRIRSVSASASRSPARGALGLWEWTPPDGLL